MSIRQNPDKMVDGYPQLEGQCMCTKQNPDKMVDGCLQLKVSQGGSLCPSSKIWIK